MFENIRNPCANVLYKVPNVQKYFNHRLSLLPKNSEGEQAEQETDGGVGQDGEGNYYAEVCAVYALL